MTTTVNDLVRDLGPAAAITAGLGGIGYWVNGLTVPQAEVLVRVAPGATGLPRTADLPLRAVSTTAELTFWGVHGGDRAVTRLGDVLALLLLAAVVGTLTAQARRDGGAGRAWPLVASRPATATGLLVAAYGVLPGIGTWISSATVLVLAGEPDGLSPAGLDVQVGWVVAGLGYVAVTRTVRVTGLLVRLGPAGQPAGTTR